MIRYTLLRCFFLICYDGNVPPNDCSGERFTRKIDGILITVIDADYFYRVYINSKTRNRNNEDFQNKSVTFRPYVTLGGVKMEGF